MILARIKVPLILPEATLQHELRPKPFGWSPPVLCDELIQTLFDLWLFSSMELNIKVEKHLLESSDAAWQCSVTMAAIAPTTRLACVCNNQHRYMWMLSLFCLQTSFANDIRIS